MRQLRKITGSYYSLICNIATYFMNDGQPIVAVYFYIIHSFLYIILLSSGVMNCCSTIVLFATISEYYIFTKLYF